MFSEEKTMIRSKSIILSIKLVQFSGSMPAYVKDVDGHLENIEGIAFLREENSKMLYKVGSG